MSRYSHLLSPLKVAHLTLPNRMVMGAAHTRLETLDRADERLCAFYAQRARGEIALMLTGGHSPTPEGVMEEIGPEFSHEAQVSKHQKITSAVHQAGGRIALQILHAGRYAKVSTCVAPSEGKARINIHSPRALETDEVWQLIESYARTAALAKQAGYDGVEIMGSEGYLICEFTAPRTNHREDEFGGRFENRIRFPLEIVKAVRERAGKDFMVIYRISAIDLVEGGMTGTEIATLARAVEAAGADLINTGIGWHESAIPTIAAAVPRGAWVQAVRNVKQAVAIPVMASNRINEPDVAQEIIATGAADLVSMVRPILADPDFAQKVRLNTIDEIRPCIACNQACLDHIFTNQVSTCLVNPRSAREVEYADAKASPIKHIAVVGGGPAGMVFAIEAAARGHKVRLFEQERVLGGQLNLAKIAPGKTEFNEFLNYLRTMLNKHKVNVQLGKTVSTKDLYPNLFDEVVLATGIFPRVPDITGINHKKVVSYIDVLTQRVQVGETVAIIGAGGIGFDVADFLVGDDHSSTNIDTFKKVWGVDASITTPGGLTAPQPRPTSAHQIHMFQRKPGSLGKTLGKSTGWILKDKLSKAGVVMTGGVTYNAIDDAGLHYTQDGVQYTLAADHVILCSGQISNQDLYNELIALGAQPHLIGGAQEAGELDACRAIEQATRLATQI